MVNHETNLEATLRIAMKLRQRQQHKFAEKKCASLP